MWPLRPRVGPGRLRDTSCGRRLRRARWWGHHAICMVYVSEMTLYRRRVRPLWIRCDHAGYRRPKHLGRIFFAIGEHWIPRFEIGIFQSDPGQLIKVHALEIVLLDRRRLSAVLADCCGTRLADDIGKRTAFCGSAGCRGRYNSSFLANICAIMNTLLCRTCI